MLASLGPVQCPNAAHIPAQTKVMLVGWTHCQGSLLCVCGLMSLLPTAICGIALLCVINRGLLAALNSG